MKMNNAKKTAYILASAIFCLLAAFGKAHAEEALYNLSLGFDKLTQTTDDPKAPPPTSLLTAKYGFKGTNEFKPYLGTGLAYTFQQENKPGDKTRINAGVAGQAGFNYLLGGNSSLNIDYKYLHITPDAKHGDTPPQSIGVGIKIKF